MLQIALNILNAKIIKLDESEKSRLTSKLYGKKMSDTKYETWHKKSEIQDKK